MDEFAVNYPKDSIVLTNVLNTLSGGRTVEALGGASAVIEAGTVIVNDSGLRPLSSGVIKSSQASGDNTCDVAKGHGFQVGDSIKGGTITAIDSTTSETVDSITCSGTFGATLSVDEEIVNDGGLAIGLVVTSQAKDAAGKVHVGIMNVGEANENALPAPIDSNVKGALSLVSFTSDNA